MLQLEYRTHLKYTLLKLRMQELACKNRLKSYGMAKNYVSFVDNKLLSKMPCIYAVFNSYKFISFQFL